MNFLPDYGTLSVNGRYRPTFKLFDTDGWRPVMQGKAHVEFDTQEEARSEAKACVKRILNPKIEAEQMEAKTAAEDVLGVEAWRCQRDRAAAEERSRVFGDAPLSVVRDRRGREVPVEVRRARA